MSGTGAHQGTPTSAAQPARPWSTAITATTDERVFVRGVPLDEAIGGISFPAMLLHMWRGVEATPVEADVLGACLVASIDHGPLSPSALVTRTVSSTRGAPMSAIAAGMLSFSDFHGAVVTRAMHILAGAPADGDIDEWAREVFESERAAGRRLPGIGHRWHHNDLRAERLMEIARPLAGGGSERAIRALAAQVAAHSNKAVPVNVDGGLAVALSALDLDPVYGDFLFAIARSFGLAAHYVEEATREMPMRTIDPTLAGYDGPPLPSA